MITILEIPRDRDLEMTIYKITQLNLFFVQMGDSYDSEMNTLMNNFYRNFFEDVDDLIVHDATTDNNEVRLLDRTRQRQGIDKTIKTKNGKELFIEEKFRAYTYWDIREQDILLEYISIDNRNIPGWVYTSKSDYLVIVFQHLDITQSELYVFPFEPIRKWVREKNDKFMEFRDISAHNIDWNTISKAVPLSVIRDILKKEDKKFLQIHKIK